MKLKLTKCKFLKPRIKFLGHKVDEERIHTVDDKITAVTNFPHISDYLVTDRGKKSDFKLPSDQKKLNLCALTVFLMDVTFFPAHTQSIAALSKL